VKRLEVSIKTVYGVERIYPMNDNARSITHLIGKKTFTREDIEVLKRLGFEIVQVEQVTL